jgi:hypothetical protein
MALTQIAEYSDRIAADLARLNLGAAGIEAFIFDGGMASLGLGMMTPARLMVNEDDKQAAIELLGSP